MGLYLLFNFINQDQKYMEPNSSELRAHVYVEIKVVTMLEKRKVAIEDAKEEKVFELSLWMFFLFLPGEFK